MGKHQGRKQRGFGTWHRAAVVAVAGLPIAASAADGTYLGLVGGANFLKDQNFTIIYPNNDGPLLGGTAIGKVNSIPVGRAVWSSATRFPTACVRNWS